MDEDKKYRIAVLAEDAHVKRETFLALGMMNTPATPDQKVQARMRYEIARAEMLEAEKLLRQEQES